MLNFSNLLTPPNDGDTLIEPLVSHWPRLIEENIQLQKQQNFTLAGTPVKQVQQATRLALFAADSHKPTVATGHQPDFIHTGVWAKHVVVHFVTQQQELNGLNLVVDNDVPKSAALLVPTTSTEELVSTEQITFLEARAGCAFEGRELLDSTQLDTIRKDLAAFLGTNYAESMLSHYLDGLSAANNAGDIVDQHICGRKKIDLELAADLNELRVSHIFGGPFVADLLLDARRFVAAYNQSLADYRRMQNVRSPHRPLPDLGCDGERFETALWIYEPLKRRQRLWVEHSRGRLLCYADRTHVGTLAVDDLKRDPDAALKSLAPMVVRPRALALTLWARLLACDLFVHGIGGAKYDRITDGIFHRYYKCPPPAYACVSATLRLPLPQHEATLPDLASAQCQQRDLLYNPQRHITNPPADLVEERWRLIRESDRLRETRGPRPVRRQVFLGIRQINAQLLESNPKIKNEYDKHLKCLRQQVESNQLADSRDYFYALQSPDRLAMLVDQLIKASHHKKS